MESHQTYFRDRDDAGQHLARALERFRGEDVVVCALPRGGVVVAAHVAQHLDCPLELLVGRKLGAPQQPEFAIGAIAPNGIRVIDQDSVKALGITEADLDQIAATEFAEMQRRIRLYRGHGEPPVLRDKTVLLIDDGIATGLTSVAAIRSLRRANAKRVILAVPVAAKDSVEMLSKEADEVIALHSPEPFHGVGVWYGDFDQVEDETVLRLLGGARPSAAEAST